MPYSLWRYRKVTPSLWPMVLLAVYILAFLAATYNHLVPFLEGGFFVYLDRNPLVPFWLDLYWTALLFLDFSAVVLLVLHIPAGLIAYFIIIASDVAVNFSFVIAHSGVGGVLNFFQLCQLAFLVGSSVCSPLLYISVKRVCGTGPRPRQPRLPRQQ